MCSFAVTGPMLSVVEMIGEFTLALWLLIKGARTAYDKLTEGCIGHKHQTSGEAEGIGRHGNREQVPPR